MTQVIEVPPEFLICWPQGPLRFTVRMLELLWGGREVFPRGILWETSGNLTLPEKEEHELGKNIYKIGLQTLGVFPEERCCRVTHFRCVSETWHSALPLAPWAAPCALPMASFTTECHGLLLSMPLFHLLRWLLYWLAGLPWPSTTDWVSYRKFIFSRFWRLEVSDRGVRGFAFPWGLPPGLHVQSSCFVLTWSFLCVCASLVAPCVCKFPFLKRTRVRLDGGPS